MASFEDDIIETEAYSRDTTRRLALVEHHIDANSRKPVLEFFDIAGRGERIVHRLLKAEAGRRLSRAVETTHFALRRLALVRRGGGGIEKVRGFVRSKMELLL